MEPGGRHKLVSQEDRRHPGKSCEIIIIRPTWAPDASRMAGWRMLMFAKVSDLSGRWEYIGSSLFCWEVDLDQILVLNFHLKLYYFFLSFVSSSILINYNKNVQIKVKTLNFDIF